MSFSKKARNFRAEPGKKFPDDCDQIGFVAAIAGALREEFGDTPAKIKAVARLTETNEKTVKNWFCGRNGPSGESLVGLMRHSPIVLQLILRRAGHPDLVKALQVAAAHEQLRLAIATLSDLFGPNDEITD